MGAWDSDLLFSVLVVLVCEVVVVGVFKDDGGDFGRGTGHQWFFRWWERLVIDARCSTFFGGFDVFRGVFEGLQIVEMKESVSICNDDDDDI